MTSSFLLIVCCPTDKLTRGALPSAGKPTPPSNHALAGDSALLAPSGAAGVGRRLPKGRPRRTPTPNAGQPPPTEREPALAHPLHARTPCHSKRALNLQPRALLYIIQHKAPVVNPTPVCVTGLAASRTPSLPEPGDEGCARLSHRRPTEKFTRGAPPSAAKPNTALKPCSGG